MGFLCRCSLVRRRGRQARGDKQFPNRVTRTWYPLAGFTVHSNMQLKVCLKCFSFLTPLLQVLVSQFYMNFGISPDLPLLRSKNSIEVSGTLAWISGIRHTWRHPSLICGHLLSQSFVLFTVCVIGFGLVCLYLQFCVCLFQHPLSQATGPLVSRVWPSHLYDFTSASDPSVWSSSLSYTSDINFLDSYSIL